MRSVKFTSFDIGVITGAMLSVFCVGAININLHIVPTTLIGIFILFVGKFVDYFIGE